jgi:hypothetical protein
MVLHDDPNLYPSDGLVVKINMLVEQAPKMHGDPVSALSLSGAKYDETLKQVFVKGSDLVQHLKHPKI